MVQQTPWSVKGIRPECREAAKVAARRAGLTIGEWLNRAIMDAAKHEVQGGAPIADNGNQLPALPMADLIEAIETLSKDIREQNDRVEEQAGETGRRAAEETVAPVMDSVRELEKNVEAKLDALDNIEIDGQMQERLRDAQAKADRASLAVAPLERTVQRLAQRLERMDPMDPPPQQQRQRQRRGLLGRLFGG